MVSKITWDSFAHWEVAFKADRAQAELFERFQEVRIPLSLLQHGVVPEAGQLKAVLNLRGDDEEPSIADYRAVLNGKSCELMSPSLNLPASGRVI